MAIKRQYTFENRGMKIVTPVAETLFMCLRDANEYTGKFGGKLVFTPELLDTRVPVTVAGATNTVSFKDAINDLLDDCVSEYEKTGKKANRADLIKDGTDKDGVPNGKFEVNIKSMERPIVVDSAKVKVPENKIPLLSNGSKVKAQLNVVPYVMNGNVGLTCYINAVQLIDVIEYGADNSGFDVEDGYVAEAVNTDEIQF